MRDQSSEIITAVPRNAARRRFNRFGRRKGFASACYGALEVAAIGIALATASAAPPISTKTDTAKNEDIVVADFEAADYGMWKAEGTAFGDRPARGPLPGQMNVEGFSGKGLVNSFVGGDDATGTLASPPLTIQRKYINFLIGGGNHPGKTCINLLVDGKPVRTASGPNSVPGGSERLDWHSWNVADLHGKQATIEIVDQQRGGWGHINIDDIRQSDRPRGNVLKHREVVASKRYLHLPVKTGSPIRVLRVRDGDRTVHEFDIELADDKADFTTFIDLGPLHGRTLTLETTLPIESAALDRIAVSDDVPAASDLYNERNRPQFHFTSRRGWLNDPNGLVYYDGEYHLFYQHNPYGWNWGNMHWGHAVSRDLFHWNELPIGIYPHKHGDWAFSGSAVVDRNNTSGWKIGANDLIVAAYTSTGRGECIAFSNDRGRTWQEFDGNPVVKHTGRDPRLLWHEPTSRWIMAVFDEERGQRIAFHSSSDLKHWTLESYIDGFFECPDLVKMPLDGDAAQAKWILYAADGRYLVGEFDGHRYTPDGKTTGDGKTSGKRQLWHGNHYAAQTFTNAPDGRILQMGWGQNIAFPGMPFNQQMCVPVELKLKTTSDGPRLFAMPTREIEKLRRTPALVRVGDMKIGETEHVLSYRTSDTLDATLEIEPQKAAQIVLTVNDAQIRFDAGKHVVSFLGKQAEVPLTDGLLKLRVLVDRGSVELFAGDGAVAISSSYQPKSESGSIRLRSSGGDARLKSASVFALESAWKSAK
jgi:fructan beta-fructosidase